MDNLIINQLDLNSSRDENLDETKIHLVKYCQKHFENNFICDFSFIIGIKNHFILRRILLGDNIDLNMFVTVLKEIFDFSDKNWKLNFKNFSLSGNDKEDKIIYKTETTEKKYDPSLIFLSKLNIKSGDKFFFIYDTFGDKWKIEANVKSTISVNEIINKIYSKKEDKEIGFAKLKSLFRPILINGKNQAPPEGFGGSNDFLLLLKNKENSFHPVTQKYIEYYKELYEDEETQDLNKVNTINNFIYDFDFEGLQESFAEINFLKFYNQIRKEEDLFENSIFMNDVKLFGHEEFDSIDDFDNASYDPINESDLKIDLNY